MTAESAAAELDEQRTLDLASRVMGFRIRKGWGKPTVERRYYNPLISEILRGAERAQNAMPNRASDGTFLGSLLRGGWQERSAPRIGLFGGYGPVW